MNNNVMVNCGVALAIDDRCRTWGILKPDGSSSDMLLKMNVLNYQQVCDMRGIHAANHNVSFI